MSGRPVARVWSKGGHWLDTGGHNIFLTGVRLCTRQPRVPRPRETDYTGSREALQSGHQRQFSEFITVLVMLKVVLKI